MSKLRIISSSKIDSDEEKIFREVFGENKIEFKEYRVKGLAGGAFDVQIIIDTLNDPTFTAMLHGLEFINLIALLIKKLFNRNTKPIMDNGNRPRYTTLIIRKETSSVSISNVNPDNKIFISKITTNFKEIKRQIMEGKVEYSIEKLKHYLE